MSRPKGTPAPEQITPFNPLDYANLTKNVVEELMRQGPFKLPLERQFTGAGVYALFYIGDDPDYTAERSLNATHPIYVGKAAPKGSRKGVIANEPIVGNNLYKRIREHYSSINAAVNLQSSDFLVRYLVVEPLWIFMAEQFLITNFKPLWNLHLDGFGNHIPGDRRKGTEVSWWDARHPGRSWAAELPQTRTSEQAKDKIREYYRLKESEPAKLELLAKAVAARKAATED